MAAEELNLFPDLGADALVAKGPLEEMSKHILSVIDLSDTSSSKRPLGRALGLNLTQPRTISKELLSIKKRHELLMDRMSEGIVETDVSGSVAYANPAALAIIGASEGDLLGSNFLDFFSGNDRKRVAGVMGTLGTDPVIISDEEPVSLNDLLIALSIIPVTEDPAGAVIILNNVSRRKQIEAALRKEQEKLQTVMEESPYAVALIGKEGRYRYWNSRFAELFGDPSQDGSLSCANLKSRLEKAMLREQAGARADNHRSRNAKTVRLSMLTLEDGPEKFIQWTPIRMETGEELIFYEDVTERRRLEDQFNRSRRLESLGIITGGVAHNFKNILAAIMANSQIIEMNMYRDDAHLKTIVERVNTAVKRGAQLIQALIQFSRKQTGSEFREINMSKILREIFQPTERFEGQDIEILLDAEEPLPVSGDRASLSQLFLILLDNAVDALPTGGRIEVTARIKKGTAQVIVSDDGVGMNEETRLKCFDPFFTTKEVHRGTGMGLSIAHGIVKDHGGRIEVESALDRGTSFRLSFPLAASV